MAEDINALVLTMSADIRRLEKSLNQGQRAFDRTANAIEKRQRELDRNLSNLGSKVGNFARPVQLAATVALGAITAMSYQAARRAEAVDGAFEQVFRDMPAEASKATAAISNEFGRLETDIKDNFTQLRAVVSALGVDAQTSLGIVDQLQRRSLDMAAFKDVSDAEAFRAVISGITGETEPLKRFGVVLNETAVATELVRLGFKGKAKDASESAKVVARTNIILRQTAGVSGQVAREVDTLAEKEKRAQVEFTRAAEQFGKQFLPVAAKVLDWAADALKAFNELPSGVQVAGVALLGLVAASGPIAMVIKGLSDLIKAAIAAKAAMGALGAAGGAGATAKGAAAGGAAGVLSRVAPVAAAGAGLLVGTGSFAPAPERDRSVVEASLKFEQDRLARLRREGRNPRGIQNAEQRVARLQREVQTLASDAAEGATNEVEKAVRDALAAAPDFGLTPDQQRPVGGGSGGGKTPKQLAAEAARRAELQEQLRLERAIDIARASGDTAAVKAAEERQTLAQMTAQYEAAGYKDAAERAREHLSYINAAEVAAEEREKAEEQIDIILAGRRRQIEREADYQQRIQDQLYDRLALELELARLAGHDGRLRIAERELWIEERINELLRIRPELNAADARDQAGREWTALDNADTEGALRDEFRRSFSEGIRAAIDGDLGGFFENLADRFTDRMLDNLADDLFDLLASAAKGFGQGGGGGTGWLSSIASLFAGKRASGGAVVRGQAYITGERRPEVFVPNTSGTIIPSVNAAMNRAQQAHAARQQPVIVQLAVDEGGLFVPRVQAISGAVAVQTTTMGVATVQDQQRTNAMRRRQSLVG